MKVVKEIVIIKTKTQYEVGDMFKFTRPNVRLSGKIAYVTSIESDRYLVKTLGGYTDFLLKGYEDKENGMVYLGNFYEIFGDTLDK